MAGTTTNGSTTSTPFETTEGEDQARRSDLLNNPFGVDAPNVPDYFSNYNYEWTRTISSLGPDRLGRIPMVITTDAWVRQGRYIVMWCSPETVQWQFRMRGAVEKTRTGTIQHYWRDSIRSTFFDEPELSITFQSGNIMPIRMTQLSGASRSTIVEMPKGLMNLYEFMELLDQPKALSNGLANNVMILYSSNVFPRVVLRGFFSPDGLAINEQAADHAEVKWNVSYTVTGSYPKFQSGRDLSATWASVQRARGWEVVQPSVPSNAKAGTEPYRLSPSEAHEQRHRAEELTPDPAPADEAARRGRRQLPRSPRVQAGRRTATMRSR